MHMKGILLVVAILLLGGGTVLFFTRTNTIVTDRPPTSDATAEKRPSDLDRSQNVSIQKQPDDSMPQEIAWLTDYDKALQQAKKEDKLIVIDFFATWCAPCKVMERTTFADERVRRRMTEFVPLKIDVDQQREIAAKYGIQSLPTTAVVGSDGKPVAGAIGYLDVDRFMEVLSKAQPDGQAQSERVSLPKTPSDSNSNNLRQAPSQSNRLQFPFLE